jgi:hypothetical protein
MKLIPSYRASQLLVLAPLLSALAFSFPTWSTAEQIQAMTPGELVRRTISNEMKSTRESGKYMFRERKETPSGSQTKLLVETRDAMVGMVVAYNDRPLNRDERQGEYTRIQRFIDDPQELDRKHRKEQEDAERVRSILKALPDAFLYEYDGSEMGKPGLGKVGESLVRLKFRPNPKYDPPTRVEQVLTGMQGIVLIDPQEQHIAKIDGTLFQEVGFGWGILGHLDRGGHFLVDQAEVGDGNWSISRMDLAFTGKVLLFKNLNIKSTELYSEFHPVPADLTFAQGAELLKKQLSTVAENQMQNGSGK